MSDVGIYQCRVYNIDYYPCKYRYGHLTGVAVSGHNGSPDWISIHVAMILIIAAVIASVIFLTVTSCLIYQGWKFHKQSHGMSVLQNHVLVQVV